MGKSKKSLPFLFVLLLQSLQQVAPTGHDQIFYQNPADGRIYRPFDVSQMKQWALDGYFGGGSLLHYVDIYPHCLWFIRRLLSCFIIDLQVTENPANGYFVPLTAYLADTRDESSALIYHSSSEQASGAAYYEEIDPSGVPTLQSHQILRYDYTIQPLLPL